MKTLLVIILIVGGLVVAAVMVGAPAVGEALRSLQPEPEVLEVRVATVSSGTLVETISAPGTIEPRTKVEISSEVSARIEQLPFREGDVVAKGDMVVKLDDRDLQAALESARSRKTGEENRLQAEQARVVGLASNLRFAVRQQERKQALFDSGDISSRELDEADERVDDLESGIEAARFTISVIESSMAGADADVDRALEALSKTVITAPMDGKITALNAEIGEVVLVGTMNNPGTVILTIADLSRMIVKAEVSEVDVARIAEGQPAKVHIIAYRDDVFSGVVTQIALQRSVTPNGTGFFETEVEIDTREELIRSGHAANVDIEVGRHEGLSVEDQAIRDFAVDELPEEIRREHPLVDRSRRTTEVVFRMQDGAAVLTPVRTGPSDLTHTLVTEGLEAGDRVIIGPFKVLEQLEPGAEVLEIGTAAAADPGDDA